MEKGPGATVTDPKPVTRTLLIEIRDPVAGVVEVFAPSDEELREFGLVRVPPEVLSYAKGARVVPSPSGCGWVIEETTPVASAETLGEAIEKGNAHLSRIPDLVVPTNGHANGEDKP